MKRRLTFNELLEIIFFKIINFTKRLNNYIIFKGANDLEGNAGAFYQYLIDNNYNKKYKIIWLVRNEKYLNEYNEKNVKIVQWKNRNKYSILELYYLCTAKYLIWDNEHIKKNHPLQRSIYLTHGSPIIKNVKGFIHLGDDVDHVLVPSDKVIDMMSYQYSYNSEKAFVCGLPRNDYIFDNKKYLRKLTNKEYNKIIIWLPTWRNSSLYKRNDSNSKYKFGLPLIKSIDILNSLNKFLNENNCLLIIKTHILQDFQKYNLISTNNILFLTQNDIENKKINLYSLFNETDALLTDYSSVNFDYLLLNKPIGYVIDDFENYKNRPGFAMKNPLDVMPGDKLYSVKDLYRFIETLLKGEDNYRESREKVNEWANKYHDNKNCERLLKIIKKFYKDF